MSEKMEKWELQELVDEAVATGQITPEMINEYVYEMKVGGRLITDLTAASYHQLALERGITTEKIKREDMTDGVMYTVSVAQVDDEKPSELWQRRTGVSFEPFLVNTYDKYTKEWTMKFDRFCYQKALTKALRNAIKQLVSATERFNAMKALKEIPLTVGAKQDALPAPVSNDAADAKAAVKERPAGEPELVTLRNRCFALYRVHNSEVDNPKLQTGDCRIPVDFWKQVRDRFGVKSRATMELRHWRECLQMIFDLLRQAEDAEAKAEQEMQDTAERKFLSSLPAQDAALDKLGAASEADAEKQKIEEARKVDDESIPF